MKFSTSSRPASAHELHFAINSRASFHLPSHHLHICPSQPPTSSACSALPPPARPPSSVRSAPPSSSTRPSRGNAESHAKLLAQHYREHIAALRAVASDSRGAVLDGCISSALLLVDLDVAHGRLTRSEAATLNKFGASLLRHLPPPDVVLHLDASAKACLERAGAEHAALALADHETLYNGTHEVARTLRHKGSEVYARKWDRFGPTNALRDAVLCAPPQSATRSSAKNAPPSPLAVERIINDAWAAAQAATAPLTPIVNRQEAESSTVLVAPRPRRAEINAGMMPPASPLNTGIHTSASCEASPGGGESHSPVSILTRIEDTLKLRIARSRRERRDTAGPRIASLSRTRC